MLASACSPVYRARLLHNFTSSHTSCTPVRTYICLLPLSVLLTSSHILHPPSSHLPFPSPFHFLHLPLPLLHLPLHSPSIYPPTPPPSLSREVMEKKQYLPTSSTVCWQKANRAPQRLPTRTPLLLNTRSWQERWTRRSDLLKDIVQ